MGRARGKLKRATAIAAGAVLALTLSGCMRMHTSFVINEDDTIDGSMIMAISDEAAETAGMTADEMWAQASDSLTADMPAGITTTPYKQDGYTGEEFVYENTPLSDASGSGMSITREGDEFVVTGELDLTEEELDGADTSGVDMASALDIQFSVTFPGEVIESNGVVDGSTVTWVATYGEILVLDARGEASGSGGSAPSDDATTDPADDTTGDATDTESSDSSDVADEDSDGTNWILWASIGVGALAIIGLVVWLVLRGRNNGGQGGPGAPQGWGAYPQGPGQPGAQQPWGQQPGQSGQQYGQPTQPYGQPPVQQPGQGDQFGQNGQPGQFGQPGQPGPAAQPGQPGQFGQPGQGWGPPAQPGDQQPPQWGQQP